MRVVTTTSELRFPLLLYPGPDWLFSEVEGIPDHEGDRCTVERVLVENREELVKLVADKVLVPIRSTDDNCSSTDESRQGS